MTATKSSRQGRCPVPDCAKVFKKGHMGIDEHVHRAHGDRFPGATKEERCAAFLSAFPAPWTYVDHVDHPQPTMALGDEADADVADDLDFTHSTYREKLLEHIFVSEVLQEAWVRQRRVIDILRSEVDASGYDLVLVCGTVMRHVQLKSSKLDGRVDKQNVNVKLADAPAGCVVWLLVDEDRKGGKVKLSYLYYGGAPDTPLPDLGTFKVARRTTPNSQGVRPERPGIREVPRREFKDVPYGVTGLLEALFGKPPQAASVP